MFKADIEANAEVLTREIKGKIFRNRPCSEMNIDAFNEDKLYAVISIQ